jgi:MSHA pilin protein MshC
LRYAQKSAIAQRRLVCVAFGSNTATLKIASTNPPPATPCNLNLAGPTGSSPYTITATGTTTFTGAPAVLNFDPLGEPVDNSGNLLAASSISVTGQPVITIEQETGYVH